MHLLWSPAPVGAAVIDLPWPVIGLLIWAAVLALDLAYTLVTSRRRRGADK